MSLFRSTKAQAEEYVTLINQIKELTKQVASLRGEREAQQENLDLEEEYEVVKRKLTDLQITFERDKEKWDREKREVTHMVGLQKLRGEFDSESAAREAVLTVREENLEADKARFDDHVKFIEERFTQQFDSLNDLMGKFLERMPTTQQLITVGSKNGQGDDS